MPSRREKGAPKTPLHPLKRESMVRERQKERRVREYGDESLIRVQPLKVCVPRSMFQTSSPSKIS